MYILSQDRLIGFMFENLIGIGPNANGLIAINHQGKYVLGIYDTDEQKIKIQNEIANAYANGEEIYRMPENNI